MNHTPHTLVIGISAAIAASAWAQDSPAVFRDASGDAVAHRTDLNADGPLNSQSVLPDLLYVAVGGWNASSPRTNPYAGNWTDGEVANLFRVDVVFRGLVNPLGPNGLSGPDYEPFRYGPSPVYGYVEFDLDDELDTGGEIDQVADRILGNAARFGGRLEGTLGERAAVSGDDLDHDLRTLPAVERSGEEWHLSLCGCDDYLVVETFGDTTPGSFDAGDTWILSGRILHRTHAFAEYSFAFGGSGPGEYDPPVLLRFKHDPAGNRTIITLVEALTQLGAAQLRGEPLQDWDLDASNHTSIEEMLNEIRFTAVNSQDPGQGTSFDLLREWSDGDHDDWEDFRDPKEWNVNALFATAYVNRETDAVFVWTDLGFDHQFGDVDGDGEVDDDDQDAIMQFIAQIDGTADDDDLVINGQVFIADFGPNFLLYDLNYDGSVNASDLVEIGYRQRGDVNVDRQFDTQDVGIVDDLNGAQRGDPAYNPAADLNSDGRIDSIDSQFIRLLLLYGTGARALTIG